MKMTADRSPACPQQADAIASGKAAAATYLVSLGLLRRGRFSYDDAFAAATTFVGAMLLRAFLMRCSRSLRLKPAASLMMLAKYPRRGCVKTRLAAALCAARSASADAATPSKEASAAFALASLSDLLLRFGRADLGARTQRCLLYAPPTKASRDGFGRLLAELCIADKWWLVPAAEFIAGHPQKSNADPV